MSEIRERQYQVKGGKTTPFFAKKKPNNQSLDSRDHSKKKSRVEPNGPYGSLWGLQHLDWLHIHFAQGSDWEDLFPPASELSQSSKIVMNLEQKLGADWKWICCAKHDDSLSIYSHFQRLILQRKKDDDYKTSTHVSTSSDTQSLRNSMSPQQNDQSTISRQGM